MARKRKTEAAPRLDEADRTLHSTFCSAANSLSQLYSQAIAQQKQSFHAGELHALDKLYHWILRKYEEESRLTIADIMAHIQHEIDYGCSDAPVAQGVQQQYPPSARQQLGNSSSQLSATSHGQASGLAPRAINTEQSKNNIFSNALSSPVRRSLQNYHPTQGQGQGGGNGGQSSMGSASPGAQNRDADSAGSDDTVMDMV